MKEKSGQEYLEYLPERGWTPYAEMLQNIKGVYDRMVKNGFGSEEEIRTAIAKRLGSLVFFVDQCLCHAEYLTHEAFEKLSSQRMESDFFLEVQKLKRTLINKLIANGFSEKKITGRISELVPIMKDEYCLSGRIERKRYKEAADKNWGKSALSRPKAKSKPLKYSKPTKKTIKRRPLQVSDVAERLMSTARTLHPEQTREKRFSEIRDLTIYLARVTAELAQGNHCGGKKIQ